MKAYVIAFIFKGVLDEVKVVFDRKSAEYEETCMRERYADELKTEESDVVKSEVESDVLSHQKKSKLYFDVERRLSATST